MNNVLWAHGWSFLRHRLHTVAYTFATATIIPVSSVVLCIVGGLQLHLQFVNPRHQSFHFSVITCCWHPLFRGIVSGIIVFYQVPCVCFRCCPFAHSSYPSVAL